MTISRGFITGEGARRRRRGRRETTSAETTTSAATTSRGGSGEDREGDASLEEASDDDKIYGAIASGQGVTTTNAKSAKDENDEEGCMMGIPQFWVRAMGHMEAVAELIMERDIDYLEHLTDVTCRYFEDGTGFKLRFTFDIKTNEYFTDELLIKRYEVHNLLLDDEPILKNERGAIYIGRRVGD